MYLLINWEKSVCIEIGVKCNCFTFCLLDLGLLLPAILLCCVQFAGCNHAAVVAIVTFAVGLGGFCMGGFTCNHIDIASNFSGLKDQGFYFMVLYKGFIYMYIKRQKFFKNCLYALNLINTVVDHTYKLCCILHQILSRKNQIGILWNS